MKKITESGQTLVEAIVVVAIVVLLVTGLVVATTVSLKSVRQNQIKIQAVSLAQAGMEIVRSVRDSTDWATFFANADNTNNNNGLQCLGKSGLLSSPPCTADITTAATSYTRTAQFTNIDAGSLEVTITVTTADNSITPVTLSSYFTEWKSK